MSRNGKDSQHVRTLIERFISEFGDRNFLWHVFAPGRVNIIGEHTDYSGYSVLPVAISRGIHIICAPRSDSRIVIRNIDARFAAHEFDCSACAEQYVQGDWGNYVKAAIRGCLEEVRGGADVRIGFDAMYAGDLPIAAGLSSSSALVVATGLVFLSLSGIALERLALAELLARAERHTGTQGGGMDQAASLLGLADHAVRIEFFPLRVAPVPIPRDWAFVVADTLEPAPKSAEVQHIYNMRVLECRIAAAMIAHWFGRPTGEIASLRLADVDLARLNIGSREFEAALDRVLPDGALSFDDVRGLVGAELAEALRSERDRIMPRPCDSDERYRVRARYLHVIGEAARVEAAAASMRARDMAACGALLDASHESCRDLYEVSSPALDALVALAGQAGAQGSRLTGAGFGGCTVSLVRREAADGFMRELRDGFYRNRIMDAIADIDDHLFIAEPSDGAFAERLEAGEWSAA
jgi:N-acetylgalactosamine kinase